MVINLSNVNHDKFIHKIDSPVLLDLVNEQIDVNIKGCVNILACCLPQMRRKKYGRIILMSSVLTNMPMIGTGIYAGCKGFIDSIVKTVSLENVDKGITCNSIQLGYFDGGLTHRINEDFKNEILNKIPMKRWGKIEELVNVINLFINTEYITGINQKINGGCDF